MRNLAALATLAAASLCLQTTAHAYSTTATVNFSWATGGTEIGWTAATAHTLTAMTNGTYFSSLTGNTSTNYYNADFASAAQCASIVAGLGGSAPVTRKYGCRYTDYAAIPSFVGTPLPTVGAGNLGPGAQAAGTITVTDTTLTGTLTILGTTDEPTGGTTSSIGTGSNGYNLRQAAGSPFGNSWNGVTTLGTYTLNLTGTFTATAWQITGGGARFSDAGFLCQQGGNSSPSNILCANSVAPGGFTTTGGSLSWGWELDGAATNLGNVVAGIDVRDTSNTLITTLSGVLADLSVDGLGNITTNSAEIRRALGSSGGSGAGPAVKNLSYDAAMPRISCGTLTAAGLTVTGVVDAPVVPVPAAVWLFGSALGLLAVARRRYPPSEQPVQPVTFFRLCQERACGVVPGG